MLFTEERTKSAEIMQATMCVWGFNTHIQGQHQLGLGVDDEHTLPGRLNTCGSSGSEPKRGQRVRRQMAETGQGNKNVCLETFFSVAVINKETTTFVHVGICVATTWYVTASWNGWWSGCTIRMPHWMRSTAAAHPFTRGRSSTTCCHILSTVSQQVLSYWICPKKTCTNLDFSQLTAKEPWSCCSFRISFLVSDFPFAF